MVGKVTPIEKAYQLKNHLKKKQEQRKKEKPKFPPPPDDIA